MVSRIVNSIVNPERWTQCAGAHVASHLFAVGLATKQCKQMQNDCLHHSNNLFKLIRYECAQIYYNFSTLFIGWLFDTVFCHFSVLRFLFIVSRLPWKTWMQKKRKLKQKHLLPFFYFIVSHINSYKRNIHMENPLWLHTIWKKPTSKIK